MAEKQLAQVWYEEITSLSPYATCPSLQNASTAPWYKGKSLFTIRYRRVTRKIYRFVGKLLIVCFYM